MKKHNIVFILTILITVFTCLITDGMHYFYNNPFSTNLEMQNLSGSIHDDEYTLMITDGGMSVSVLDEKMNYVYNIEGGVVDGGFYSAYDAIYLNEYIYIADGYDNARIARFTKDGKFDSYIYQSEGVITSLQAIKNDMGISEVYDGSIRALRMADDGSIISVETFQTEYNASEISDCTTYFDAENNVYAAIAMRNGNVYTFDSTGQQLKYDATAVNCNEYYSLVLEVDYDDNGTLFANDFGTREVYRIDEEITTVIEKGESSGMTADSLAEYPIYNSLNAFGYGKVSVIATEYMYDESSDSYYYQYSDFTKDTSDGTVIFYGNTVKKDKFYIIMGYVTVVAALLLCVCLVYAIIRFIRVIKSIKVETSTKVQFGVLIAVIIATVFTTSQLVDNYNKRYSDEVMNRIKTTSLMMSQNLSECDIESINSPDDCYGEAWTEIDNTIHELSDSENSEDLYYVIYREIDGVISEVYSEEDYHVGFYPMPGIFEGSLEKDIYETGEPYYSNNYNNADGSFMYTAYPVFNENGDVVAILETGTDLYVFNAQNSELVKNVLVYVVTGLTIALLILSEVIVSKEGLTDRRRAIKERRPVSPTILRPLVFIVYFVANMSTVFTPLYGTELWRESDPFSAEIAAALPLSVETIAAALAALVAGFICDKIGCKNLTFSAAAFYITGNLLAAYANNLYMFIGANICTGIAGGLFAIAINAYIAAFSDEEYRSKSFAGFNAAVLSGINCGTVVGSMIAENLGFKNTYLVAACLIPVVIILVALCMQGRKFLADFTSEEETEDSEDPKNMSIFRFICSPRVFLFLVLLNFPYIVCASFLSYFFPIYGAESMLSETQISLAFLLSGVVSIYLGPILSDLISKRMGVYRSMLFASVIYASALLFFIMSPSILSCFIVVAMFAVADSFGLTAQAVYYTNMPEVKKLGNGKAMGVNTTVENISSACGPMIFAYIFILGTEKGLMILTVGFALMAVLFVITNKFAEKKK